MWITFTKTEYILTDDDVIYGAFVQMCESKPEMACCRTYSGVSRFVLITFVCDSLSR